MGRRKGTGWPAQSLRRRRKFERKNFETVRVLMELSQARHPGCAFRFLCFTPGEVQCAWCPSKRCLPSPPCTAALCPSTPTCPGAVHASCLQSPWHLSPPTYNLSSSAPSCPPSICSCETLFPHWRRCEIGEASTMHPMMVVGNMIELFSIF